MKVWFDVSGIYSWEGNFTGIQRVVYHLGKELHASDPNAAFFLYRHGTIHEVNFRQLEDRLEAQRQKAAYLTSSGSPPTTQPPSLRKLHHYGMVLMKSVVRGTPLDPPLRAIYGRMRTVYRGARGGSVRQLAVLHPFSEGDLVIVIDGNWQFAGFAEAMATAKTRTRFRLVHAVHDLTALRNPALVNPGAEKIISNYFKKIIPIADTLVAISVSTKRDLAWFADTAGLYLPPVRVLKLGDDAVSSPHNGKERPAVVTAPTFILAVGTIEVRKNYPLLYYAYKLARQEGRQLPPLVIVGRKGWMAEEAYALLTKDREMEGTITVLEQVSDRQLAWLYDNCLFTVFPSFYEGWGLPIAESLKYGKACIASNTSSLPEVGGDLVRYISPYSPEALVHEIENLAVHPKELQAVEARIRQSYHPQTWQMAYDDFRAILADVG